MTTPNFQERAKAFFIEVGITDHSVCDNSCAKKWLFYENLNDLTQALEQAYREGFEKCRELTLIVIRANTPQHPDGFCPKCGSWKDCACEDKGDAKEGK